MEEDNHHWRGIIARPQLAAGKSFTSSGKPGKIDSLFRYFDKYLQNVAVDVLMMN